MGGRVKDNCSCNDGEDGEHNQADAVNHLGGEERIFFKESEVK